jgi:hypothetical protein
MKGVFDVPGVPLNAALRLGVTAVLLGALVSACSPAVGTEAWCDAMEDKPKGDWSTNEATDYAQNCVFRKDDD